MEVDLLMGTREVANVWVIREGKVVTVAMRWSRDRALADLDRTREEQRDSR